MAQDTPDTTGSKTVSKTGSGCFRILIGPPSEAGALEALLENTVSGQADRKLLVVEADPDRAAALETQLPQAQVMAGVVGAKSGETELVQYNFPGLSGTTPPLPALTEILPGLRAVVRKQTAVIGMDAVLKWLGKRGQAGPLDLYVDAPGSEMMILDGIAGAGLFAVCARLRLRCGAEPMFEQAAGRDALVSRCQAEGLKLVHEETEDPDFPELLFEVDLVARALEEAQSDLAKAKRKNASDKAMITKLKKGQADTVALLEEATKATATIEQKRTAALEQITTLTAEIETLKTEVEEEQKNSRQIRETLHKRNGEVEARGAAMEKARIAHETALADLNAQHNAATQQQKSAAEEEIALFTAQIEAQQAEIADEQKNTRQIREALHKRNGELEARSKAMEEAREAHEVAQAELQAQMDQTRTELKSKRENLVQLRETLHKRNSTVEAQSKELEARDQALEAQAQELEAARVQIETQAEELQVQAKALKSAKKKLGKRDAKLETHAADLAEGTTRMEALKAQVQTLEATQASSQQNLAQTRETLNKRNTALETRTRELEAARAEVTALSARSAEPDVDTLAQLEQSKADLAVALRMQMLAQSDLRDLQARFREVSQARAAQQELLEKLTPRLQQAAQQLQLIEAEPRADMARLGSDDAQVEIVPDAVPQAEETAKTSVKRASKPSSKSKSTTKRTSRKSKTAKS